VHELLMTVRSRSQIYHFAPLTLEDVRRQGVVDELTVRLSQGSIGRARSLDPETLKQQRELWLDFLETTINADELRFREMLAASGNVSRSKNDFAEYLAVATVLAADLLYLKCQAETRLVNIDIRSRLQTLAEKMPLDRLIAFGEFLRFIESSMKN